MDGRSFQFSIFHYSDGTARCCTVFLFFYYVVRIGVLFVRKDVQNRDGAVAAAAAEAEAAAEAPVIVLLGVIDCSK